jgi:16S rRNA C967 or C1407 C5-methylase (RsmB/RsmF family)/NOL1/NOP2/fmu family ribosome biogenesis protein
MAGKTRTPELPELAIPVPFLERMRSLLGDEFPAFLESYEQSPVQGLRANTLKISPAALTELLPFDLQPVTWSPETFILGGGLDQGEARPGKHPYHAAGLYYLQDPSATAPVELLNPLPGERVLDISAAPGGKATHIAARLQGSGLLVANELINKRAWELAGNLERWGATNVAITSETPERLAGRWPEFFDAVLVDAPCSGEGMFRKGDAARREWSSALVEGCAVRQDAILEQVAGLVRPGGRLVYSTCTFSPDEDEGTVARFMETHPEFSLAEPPPLPGFDRGRPDWLPEPLQRPELARCVRLWPQRVPGEGHFAALLTKNGETQRSPVRPPGIPKLGRGVEEDYRNFVAETFLDPPVAGRLVLEGAYLYALPEGLPDMTGLRYMHPGWWLGEVKKARFEPSHALALGVKAPAARRLVDFDVDNPGLLAYMRGETIQSTGDDGWALVAVNGFSLGWAKCVGGRLKSHYPKGLRVLGA